MKLCTFHLTVILSVFISLRTSGQDSDVSVSLARYPKSITAFDVSEDGSLLAVGGGSLIVISNVLDGTPIFATNTHYGTRIESVKMSPDKTKLAVLSSDELSTDRFMALYDMKEKSLVMATTLITMFVPPAKRLYEMDFSIVNKQLSDKFESLAIPAYSDRFRFSGDRLFLFFTNSVTEFYYDGKSKTSMLDKLTAQADYMQSSGFVKVKEDTIPHYYALLPWFATFDSVMKRSYHKVVFDPTLTYGFVLYTQNNRLRYEVWNIWSDKKIYEFTGENSGLQSLQETDANLLSLTPDGRSLIFYAVDSTDKKGMAIYGSMQRLDLSDQDTELVFRFPEPEPVFNVKLSADGKYLFCNGADYDKDVIAGFLNSGAYTPDVEKQLSSNLWSYSFENKKLKKLPAGNLSIPNIVFSTTLGNVFAATDKGFLRLNINENVMYPMPSFTAPEIKSLEADEKGYLWVGTDEGVRKFDLTNLRQLNYQPINNIKSLAFNTDHSKVFSSNGVNITETDVSTGKHKTFSPHKNTIGGLAFHAPSGKIISGEYVDMQKWSDSCRLLFGSLDLHPEPVPFSSSYAFENVDSIVSRDKPFLENEAPVRQLTLSRDGSYLACAMQAKMPVDPMALLTSVLEGYMKSSDDSDFTGSLEGLMDSSGSSGFMSSVEKAMDVKDSYPGEIKLWKFSKGQWAEYKSLTANREFTNRNATVPAFAFSTDSKYFAAADKSLGIHIWDVQTGNLVADCLGEHGDAFTQEQLIYYREKNKLDDFKTGYNISAMAFSPGNQYLVSAGNDKKLVIWKRTPAKDSVKLKSEEYVDADGVTKSRMVTFHDTVSYVYDSTLNGIASADITAITFTPDGKFLLIGANDGTVTLVNFIHSLVQGIILLRNHSDGYMTLGPYDIYYANPQGNNLFYFSSGNQVYPSEQFDIFFNRPDFITGFFGGLLFDTYRNDSSVTARIMRNLQRDSSIENKRLQLYGFTKKTVRYQLGYLSTELLNEPALLRSQTISADSIDLDILAKADTSLAAVHIWVNNVPVFGKRGNPVPSNLSEWKQKVRIALSGGGNLIQVACRDVKERYSLRKSVIVYNQSKISKPDLFLIVTGVDKYSYLRPLKYPVKNCRDLLNAYRKEQFANIYTDSLFNEQLTGVHIEALKKKLLRSHPDDVVVVFYSGHGKQTTDHTLFLGTTGTNTKDLAGTALPFSALDDLLDSIPARQKLLMIDACESGLTDPTTAPGKDDVPVFLETLEMFSDLNRGTGTVTIGSTSGYTNAYEWPNLRNSTFTYTLLQVLGKPPGQNGYPADYNGDGKISVTELQQYLKQHVPELNNKLNEGSRYQIDPQRPSSRTVNVSNDFRVF